MNVSSTSFAYPSQVDILDLFTRQQFVQQCCVLWWIQVPQDALWPKQGLKFLPLQTELVSSVKPLLSDKFWMSLSSALLQSNRTPYIALVQKESTYHIKTISRTSLRFSYYKIENWW